MADLREEILVVMDRLRAMTAREGDATLAKAVTQCMLTVSGGNMDCPMGEWFVDKYMSTGTLPNPAYTQVASPESPSSTGPPQQAPVVNRSGLIDRLKVLLNQNPMDGENGCYLKALAIYGRYMRADPNCPLHRLLKEKTNSLTH
jgi:hypothetical protein